MTNIGIKHYRKVYKVNIIRTYKYNLIFVYNMLQFTLSLYNNFAKYNILILNIFDIFLPDNFM